MTQEQKQLLLKDLCARLPFSIKIQCTTHPHVLTLKGIINNRIYHTPYFIGCNVEVSNHSIEDVKPYLRPMSSMTEEERKELSDYLCEQVMSNKIGITIPPNPTQGKGIPFIWMGDCLDWLDKNMFDHRGLIPMGLALPATENMYK